ncbi:MAG: tRNA (N(6)-L-threonylcarbamoyladenosine(37)-C(2))-methylthiotransferase MtaB, partial [bacterium]|nr:tRNA (N(6)-L-threonylcarbamoyladenosine(37)-C(2))-methylthiotransferase MtaB [bacterium]
MALQKQTVAFYTFGCKVNQYDTERLRADFKASGWVEVGKQDDAAVYVINTCTVTGDSDRKARQLIRSLARNHPESQIVITGCYAESRPEELKLLPNVTIVVGNKSKEQIVEIVHQNKFTIPKQEKRVSHTISEFAGHTRAFVKVQDGCNGSCAYCIVPLVRGEPRSRSQEEIVQEVKVLAGKGYREIVLAGIRLGVYGKENNTRPAVPLSSLIQELVKIDGISRIRLSSIEPMDIEVPELIDLLVNEPKLCSHLHIPLQSGDDMILSAMRRTYTIQDYARLINAIRELVPEIAITADIIVAFPGETESQFQHTLDLVERIGFAKVHVFRYSPRPGTVAEKMGNRVNSVTVKQRAHTLIQIADTVALRYKQTWIGKEVGVLVEERRDRKTGYLTGLTSHYLRVIFPGEDRLFNQLVSVKIEGIKDNS